MSRNINVENLEAVEKRLQDAGIDYEVTKADHYCYTCPYCEDGFDINPICKHGCHLNKGMVAIKCDLNGKKFHELIKDIIKEA